MQALCQCLQITSQYDRTFDSGQDVAQMAENEIHIIVLKCKCTSNKCWLLTPDTRFRALFTSRGTCSGQNGTATCLSVYLRLFWFPHSTAGPHTFILSSGGLIKVSLEAHFHRDIVLPHRNNNNHLTKWFENMGREWISGLWVIAGLHISLCHVTES